MDLILPCQGSYFLPHVVDLLGIAGAALAGGGGAGKADLAGLWIYNESPGLHDYIIGTNRPLRPD